MSRIVLTPLLALIAGSASPEGQPSFEKTDHAFQTYMGDLAELAQRWQRAAESIHRRDAAGAQALLSAPLPGALDHVWVDRQDALRKKAKMQALREETSLKDLVIRAVEEYLKKVGG